MKIDKRHLLWIMGASIIGLDQLFKVIVGSHFAVQQGVGMSVGQTWIIAVGHMRNDGLFLNWLDGAGISLLLLLQVTATLADLAAIAVSLWLFPRRPWAALPVVLLLCGIVTALIDRIVLGYIMDYIQIGPWVSVNLGDVAALAGMILAVRNAARASPWHPLVSRPNLVH